MTTTFSFLYRAFLRVLQRIRLISRIETDLAVEVIKLCREEAVLRRQICRAALDPTAIHGALAAMGIVIASSSVWEILKRHGVEPSPQMSGTDLGGVPHRAGEGTDGL